MMSKYFFDRGSPTDLIRESQRIHDEMIHIYTEQVRHLQIQVAILEDENKKLKKRLEQYENSSV